MAQDDFKQVYQLAAKLLATREHARAELQSKLARKGFDTGVIHSALDRLQAEKYLSDERYAESYVHHRGERGYGPLRIRRELHEKGVSDEMIRLAMETNETDWYALASRVRQKKFGEQAPEDWKERARQVRFLQYRGFSQDHIQHCIDWDS